MIIVLKPFFWIRMKSDGYHWPGALCGVATLAKLDVKAALNVLTNNSIMRRTPDIEPGEPEV